MGTPLLAAAVLASVTRPSAYEHTRYLEAKRTVDDRALHRPTLDRLREELAACADPERPLRVVEVGCGTGAMLRRLLERDVLSGEVEYVGYDLRADVADRAVDEIAAWGERAGYEVTTGRVTGGDGLGNGGLGNDGRGDDETGNESPVEFERRARLESAAGDVVTVTVTAADAVERARETDAAFDLLVGCAVLDLLDLEEALAPLLGLVPGGLAYFPITFDGETFLRPRPADEGREAAVLDRYHATMDASDRPGGSRTGRELFGALPDAGATVLSGGASGWLVSPPYPGDEAYFCHHLVDGIEGAVTTALGPAGDLSRSAVAAWADERHAAIADGRLVYGAHNLGALARVGSDGD